ncbi:conserved hypothetical protein [Roseibium sp. TrichSKD4]|uniref:DUF2164 domain-containing protein n=1 Tax=Roseibium sp. TrichSKD4 TaxID=744980 RepID=UPI0001E56AE1|nr:DUF2164 domain-containing protein [Roseibium sp. TrichSKD4]EFO30690.1 conserved hypothetical protein [Roseibium sp. TrichSKD4]
MKPDTLNREERSYLASELRAYLDAELDVEIGNMDAEALIDMIGEKLGATYYNRGLKDAEALMSRKLDDISDELRTLEKDS